VEKMALSRLGQGRTKKIEVDGYRNREKSSRASPGMVLDEQKKCQLGVNGSKRRSKKTVEVTLVILMQTKRRQASDYSTEGLTRLRTWRWYCRIATGEAGCFTERRGKTKP